MPGIAPVWGRYACRCTCPDTCPLRWPLAFMSLCIKTRSCRYLVETKYVKARFCQCFVEVELEIVAQAPSADVEAEIQGRQMLMPVTSARQGLSL